MAKVWIQIYIWRKKKKIDITIFIRYYNYYNNFIASPKNIKYFNTFHDKSPFIIVHTYIITHLESSH